MQASLLEWQYPLPWPPSPFSVLLVCALAVLAQLRDEARPVMPVATASAEPPPARRSFLFGRSAVGDARS